DEIEKAHPDIFSILLQVMDHATLTDNSGRKADFRNVILIMTTNAGAREMATKSIGFVTSDKGKDRTALNKLFAPEFRNRLDAMVSFQALDADAMNRVVDKLIAELEAQLADKRVRISLTEAARSWLAKKGYDPSYGARPLRRLITSEIGDVLTDEILFGQLKNGGEAMVDCHDDKLIFSYGK
ncbi:MAG TPA: ATP-dependent Clp protease ATP-binding subunit ClpA, partial [Desulfobulbaceae bacterium]|nr:ATP-dependent Clp protease ATP-binding subunit ClpA [Desulfobulbaceae bacterium]